MSFPTTRKIAVILGGLLALLLLAVGIAAVVSARQAVDAARRVAHSQKIRSEVAELLAGIARAEMGVRARAAAADSGYLVDLRAGLDGADSALARARLLITDDSVQRRRLDAVASLLVARRAVLEETARRAEAADPGVDEDLSRQAAAGYGLTERIAAVLDSLDTAERLLLAYREPLGARQERRSQLLILSLALLAVFLSALTARFVRRDLVGRRRAEEALRASEQRFHAIFDQTFQLTALLSTDGQVLEINETALVFVEVGRSEVVGRPMPDFPWWGAAERDLIREAIAGAASGAFVRCEAQIRAPGGRTASLDLSFKPMRDGGGEVALLIAEGRDITQRLTAEAALRASEARFAGILSLAAEAIITVDDEQRVLYFNRGAENIFGHTAEEMMGQSMDRLLPARLRASHRRAVAFFGASGAEPRSMGRGREISGLHRDGHEFPVEGSISTMEVDGERLYTVVLRDVTERRQAERRQAFLADAGDKLAATLEYEPTLEHVVRLAVPVLGELCVLDLDVGPGADDSRATVAHVDPALEEVMRTMRQHYPPPWDGPHPVAVVRRTGAPILVSERDEALLRASTTSEEHCVMLDRLMLRSALFVPLIARGRVLGVLSSYSSSRSLDEDDLALAQELARRAAMAVENAQSYQAARRASLARDEVLGVVSHDLRNPLSAIIMCGEALATEHDPAELAHVGEVIRSSARWMQHIIRDLLDVTAIEAGRLSVSPERTSAPAIVEALVAMHGGAARDRSVGLDIVGSHEVTLLEADPDRVIQAVGNLLANAVRFTPAGGRVMLAVSAYEESGVAFRVSDTGTGIPAAELPHVFDRFWQGKDGRRGGIGLGLAITRGIAEAHGGWVEVASEPGAGSTFTLVLPRALSRDGSRAAGSGAAGSGSDAGGGSDGDDDGAAPDD